MVTHYLQKWFCFCVYFCKWKWVSLCPFLGLSSWIGRGYKGRGFLGDLVIRNEIHFCNCFKKRNQFSVVVSVMKKTFKSILHWFLFSKPTLLFPEIVTEMRTYFQKWSQKYFPFLNIISPVNPYPFYPSQSWNLTL